MPQQGAGLGPTREFLNNHWKLQHGLLHQQTAMSHDLCVLCGLPSQTHDFILP
uniref:Uncharacterized protein n=1 Tax=Anguilla anguilla TaxID=7936 RepID=A0A0E9PAK8_ANGAN